MFARPEYLLLLAAVPMCAVFGAVAASRRRRLAVGRAMAGLPVAGRRVKAVLFLAGLTLLGLAAAGPGGGVEPASPGPSRPLRLVIALDCSRSMLARDLRPDRLAAAKALVLDVLARLPGQEAGLVGFAGRAWLACPVTADRAGLAVALDGLSPADAPLGGTNVPAALEAARLALLGAGPGPGAVVVVSDGEDTSSGRDTAVPGPGGAGEVPVFTVAVGGAAPVSVPLSREEGGLLRDAAGAPVLVGVDAAGLSGLAGRNHGQAFRLAPDAPSPAEALAGVLAAQVPPVTDAAPPVTRSTDQTALFLGLGFALLLLDLGLSPAGGGLVLILVLALTRPALADNRAGEGVAQGLDAYAAGRYDAALRAFLTARVWDPDRPHILFDIGAAYYRLGDFAAARDAFARAGEAAGPELRARALYNQGNAAYRLGDADGAIRLYESALALAPDDADARANLDWLRSRASRPPAGQENANNGKGPGGTNPDPDGGEGKKTREGHDGHAPSPEARSGDEGAGGDRRERPMAAGSPNPSGPEDPAGPVTPMPAREGEKAGEKRAQAAGVSDPVLDRIPDLPGLPEPPRYGRPTVEKDW